MRRLGSMETALHLTDLFSPFNLVSAVQLRDGPSPDALRRALDTLQARRPELRVRIAAQAGRHYFEPAGPAPIPLQLVARASDQHWQTVAAAELDQRLPAEGPLARCTYVHTAGPGASSEIVLTYNHTCLDGDAALSLWHELLALANESAAGPVADPAVPVALAPLGPASDRLFPPGFRGWRRPVSLLGFMGAQMADEMRYRRSARGIARAPIPAQAHNKVLCRQVPAPVTSALVRRCRAERVTLNSALSAAIMLAVHQRLYAGQATALRGITLSSLRPYLQPPVPADQPGCHIAMLRYTALLAAGQPFWPLARAIHQQVYQMARRGDKFAANSMAPQLVGLTYRLQSFRLCTTALSYVGAAALPPAFGACRVLGLHAFASNNQLGAEYSAIVRLAGGELWWDIAYLAADMSGPQAHAIADDIQQRLEAAGATSGPAA